MGYADLARWTRRETLAMGLVASAGVLGFTSSLWGRGDSHLPGSRTYALGHVRALQKRLDLADDVLTFPEIRAHLVRYEPNAATRAMYPDSPPGLLLLSWVCPHLGCKVPMCESSRWFEDPCHGSRFNPIGEYKFGPAPTGMNRYAMRLDSYGDVLLADTSRTVRGAPRGTDTIRRPPAGPHCYG